MAAPLSAAPADIMNRDSKSGWPVTDLKSPPSRPCVTVCSMKNSAPSPIGERRP